MAKKDKKKQKKPEDRDPSDLELQEEVVLFDTNLEPEEDEQFTETSYTSASFETIVTEPHAATTSDIKLKKKKKPKKGESVPSVATRHSQEEHVWSDESLPTIAVTEELPPEDIKKDKKKKKGKGKEKDNKDEQPVFEKPKHWKTMDKIARAAWMEQRMEEWRIEKEAEKQDLLMGAKEKRIQLARERHELMNKDTAEQNIRRDILAKTCSFFQRNKLDFMEFQKNKEDLIEWRNYLNCDGLPNPHKVAEMNTYIHLWREDRDCTEDDLENRCQDVLPMVDKIEEIQAKSNSMSATEMQNFKEIRDTLRSLLSEAIQCASYMILRDLQKNLKFESLKKASYEREFKTLKLNIWAAIKMPTRLMKPHEPEPEPIELDFPMMKVSVKLPNTIDSKCACVRVARELMDLRSENTRTFELALKPPNCDEDLFTFNEREFEEVCKLKTEQDLIRERFYKETQDKIKELEKFFKANPYLKTSKEKEDMENLLMAEPPPMPNPRTYIAKQNENDFNKYLKQCMGRVRSGEVHLRKYRICGGTLNLDLLQTPPQPKPMKGSIQITTLQLPKCLQPMPYQVQYRAPGPPPPDVIRTPEEIEAELKKMEAAFEKLAQVFIDLPDNVMWTEPPVVCQWAEKRNLWTTNYINDYKFNEDKFTIQFRTGVLWPIGIATLKYSNLPFQGWDIKPDPKGKGVLISVTGVNVTVTWLCNRNYVKLRFIANAPNRALKEHYEKAYSVRKMVKIMREAACDFFPEYDTHNHVEGSCYKELAMENHLYHAMAFLSRGYNFQWSRWNVTAGSRAIVMQLREALDLKRQVKLQLLKVTPQRAFILKGNEMMQEFNDEPGYGQSFFPDLFTLNMTYGSMDVRKAAFNMNPTLTETVYELLRELKLCSFS